MDLLSSILVVPTTAHRLPQTVENQSLINRLWELGVSGFCFLMPEDELAQLCPNNNAKIAYNDLIAGLPREVREVLFPPPPVKPPIPVPLPVAPTTKEEKKEKEDDGGAVRCRSRDVSENEGQRVKLSAQETEANKNKTALNAEVKDTNMPVTFAERIRAKVQAILNEASPPSQSVPSRGQELER